MLMLEKKEFQQAEQLLNVGLQLDPENERLLMALAAVAIDREDWKIAESILRQTLSMNYASGAAWSDLGFVIEQQSKWTDAAEAYEKALRVFPEDNELNERLTTVRQKMNRSSK